MPVAVFIGAVLFNAGWLMLLPPVIVLGNYATVHVAMARVVRTALERF
jgi:hypothetical protein